MAFYTRLTYNFIENIGTHLHDRQRVQRRRVAVRHERRLLLREGQRAALLLRIRRRGQVKLVALHVCGSTMKSACEQDAASIIVALQ